MPFLFFQENIQKNQISVNTANATVFLSGPFGKSGSKEMVHLVSFVAT